MTPPTDLPWRLGPKDARSNVVADWIAINRGIDQLLGRQFDPEAYPYYYFRRDMVTSFVASFATCVSTVKLLCEDGLWIKQNTSRTPMEV